VRIERLVDAAAVKAGADLFDEPPRAAATEQFLNNPGHHLLFAYDDESHDGAAAVIGMISGVETTHPDKAWVGLQLRQPRSVRRVLPVRAETGQRVQPSDGRRGQPVQDRGGESVADRVPGGAQDCGPRVPAVRSARCGSEQQRLAQPFVGQLDRGDLLGEPAGQLGLVVLAEAPEPQRPSDLG